MLHKAAEEARGNGQGDLRRHGEAA